MLVFGRENGRMGMCLDNEDCAFQNLDKARFCAKCGIPLQGSLLQGRYEIQGLIAKDRSTITLSAIDRQEELPVTVRALQPNITSAEERDIFLQDAELTFALSGRINETGSIRVIEYGQDGPYSITRILPVSLMRPESANVSSASCKKISRSSALVMFG